MSRDEADPKADPKADPRADPRADASAQLRWGVYALLIALAVGNTTGRLMAVNSVNRVDLERHLIHRDIERAKGQLTETQIARRRTLQRPFLSANDRSRWLAIRALVEQGTYAIDGLLDRHVWNTIDMVEHRGRDGERHLYSSKPPLLITLLAGEYWLIHQLTGMTLGDHPYVVGRLMLVTINVLPMIWMLVLIARLAERLGTTDWGKIFVVAAASLGTLLTTFAVVLNNHIVGAVSASVALYYFVRIWCDGSLRWRDYAMVGLGASFAAANELPALSLLALVAAALWTCDRRMWLTAFCPAALLVIGAFFATNYAAHDCLTPPYMHKGSDNPEENWYLYNYTIDGVERPSYWLDRQGIDRGEPSKMTYAFHVLVGHHGVFSLTPIWLLTIAGLARWSLRGAAAQRKIAIGILALSVICLVFYIGLRPQEDRNYGGMTSGFRWMFWFAPLWLVAMLPAVDCAGRSKVGKGFALALLAMSVFSASYPTWNPWTHPWIYRWLEFGGWQGF